MFWFNFIRTAPLNFRILPEVQGWQNTFHWNVWVKWITASPSSADWKFKFGAWEIFLDIIKDSIFVPYFKVQFKSGIDVLRIFLTLFSFVICVTMQDSDSFRFFCVVAFIFLPLHIYFHCILNVYLKLRIFNPNA